MGADEEGTLARLKALRRDVLDPKLVEQRGRIMKTTGPRPTTSQPVAVPFSAP